MEIEEIKTYFEQGRYNEVLQTTDTLPKDKKFVGLSYKTLVLCLRGEIREALPVLAQLEQIASSNTDKTAQFVVLALKTCIRSYQGKEQEVYKSFQGGQARINTLSEQERHQIKEWEGWLHYGLGTFYQNSEMYEKPVMENQKIAFDIINSLPKKGGIEWILRNIVQFCAMTNQVEAAEKYRRDIYERLNSTNHVFGQVFSSFLNAGSHWIKGDYKKSIEGFTKSLPSFEEHKIYTLTVGVYNAFATISLMKGRKPENIIVPRRKTEINYK